MLWSSHVAPFRGQVARLLATVRAMSDDLRPDIADAVGRMSNKVGGKREIRKLPEHLQEGERVDRILTGTYHNGTGILVLTDRRLFFLKDGVMSKRSEDLPLSKISSIEWSSGMMLGKIAAFVSGNKAEVTNVQKVDGKALVDDVRARIADGPVAPAAPAVAAADPVEQLRKLAELRDAGVLTPEEFEAKKADLMGRI